MNAPFIAPIATHPGGRILLRIALVCCIFIVATFFASFITWPGVPEWWRDFCNATFEIGLVMGLVAPLLAIVGAVLTWRAQRRLMALDWVSFAMGLACFLLPAMFVVAYSNCPNGIC